MNKIDISNADETMNLPDGSLLALFEMGGRKKEVSKTDYTRNLFRVKNNGTVIWRIHSDEDDGEYTGPYHQMFYPFEREKLRNPDRYKGWGNPRFYPVKPDDIWVYRGGSYIYAIDLETGYSFLMDISK